MLIALLVVNSLELPLLPSDKSWTEPKDPQTTNSDDAPVFLLDSTFTPEPSGAANPKNSTLPVPAAPSQSRQAISQQPAGSSVTPRERPTDWLRILGYAWLIGSAISITRIVIDWRKVHRARSMATQVENQAALKILREEVIDLRLPHCPQLLTAETATCPAVIGMLRPAVIFPTTILWSDDREQLRFILRHELAHLYRHDLLWNLLAALAGCIFFFNPLVWLALREWRFTQELACDELAIGQSSSASSYASMLLEVALSKNPSRTLVSAAGVFESFETLKRRIERMRHFSSMSKDQSKWLVAGVVAVSAIGLVPWRLVPAGNDTSVVRAGETVTDRNDSGNAKGPPSTEIQVGGKKVKIQLADVTSVRKLRKATKHSWKAMNEQLASQIALNEPDNPDQFQKFGEERRTANTRVSVYGEAGGAAGGGGGGGGATATYTLRNPRIAMAIDATPFGNRTIRLVGPMTATVEDGTVYSGLPNSGHGWRVCPDYEAKHDGKAIGYFGKEVTKVKRFSKLQGTLQIARIDFDRVKFNRIQPRAKQRTKLGEYEITHVDQNEGLTVAIRVPTPLSMREEFRIEPKPRREPGEFFAAAHRRAAASRELTEMIEVRFLGSDGKAYTPKQTRTAGNQMQTQRISRRGRNQQFGAVAGSSQATNSTEMAYGINQLPQGVTVQALRIRVLEKPTDIEEVNFELSDVALR